jgi:HEAT repeat protein
MKPVRLLNGVLVTACFAAAACTSDRSIAADLQTELPRNGWVSWDVPAVDNAPAWCCFTDWRKDTPLPGRCELDGKSHGFGSRGRETTDTLRIYARLANGQVERLRALSPSCEAAAESPIRHLGNRNPDASAAWLRGIIKATAPTDKDASKQGRGTDRDAVAALALHRGDLALGMLADEARSGLTRERRKQAVFWLGEARGEPGVDVLKPIMAADTDAKIREHAGFAVSQSRSPRAPALLIQQGENDADTKVRSQAWFWLAQTKSLEADRAISDAVRLDPEKKVRHQAIFALSQLPAERAVKALTKVAENRDLAREDRKQAVFWLGQNKSPEAAEWLERVLLTSGESRAQGSR